MTTKPVLNIAYLTNRIQPYISWFFESLERECKGDYSGIKVIVVDYYAQAMDHWYDEQAKMERTWNIAGVRHRHEEFQYMSKCDFLHVPPKPTVWQGPHRLTSKNYFAAANARNTALCYAEDGYLVTVDDLSVLVPGWLEAVRQAMENNWVACGGYSKVKGLGVHEGEIVNFDGMTREKFDNEFEEDKCLQRRIIEMATDGYGAGVDVRYGHIASYDPVKCDGGWAYGCSFGAPVEALLAVNGWDEDCDSMGGEDYTCGVMLHRAGNHLRFLPKMMTLEAEELHHSDRPFLRFIKGIPGPRDSSQSRLGLLTLGVLKKARNYTGVKDLRELRESVLSGSNFPVVNEPKIHWYDQQELSEL